MIKLWSASLRHVSRAGSIRKAAGEYETSRLALKPSHPAVEEEFAVEIFERLPRGVAAETYVASCLMQPLPDAGIGLRRVGEAGR